MKGYSGVIYMLHLWELSGDCFGYLLLYVSVISQAIPPLPCHLWSGGGCIDAVTPLFLNANH